MGGTSLDRRRLLGGLLAFLMTLSGVVFAPPATDSANAVSGNWIDTGNRAAVVDAYNAEFDAPIQSSGWNGNRASCNAGTTSASYRSQIIDRVNYFRAMAGVPAGVVENQNLSSQAQEAALMMSATGSLSHNPSSSVFDCWTSTGHGAAGKSNLYLGRSGPEAITGYMQDPGSNNASAGHRNWILHPTTTEMGTGDIPNSGGWATNTLYVITDATFDPQPQLREQSGFVAWPPAGYVPSELVFSRWSFGLRGADFQNASVAVSHGGQTMPLSVEHKSAASNGAPFPIMVWNTGGINTSPAVDTTYTVNVNNVVVNGQAQNFSYAVTVLGDAAPASDAATEAYVDQAYLDFLGRYPSAAERTDAASLLLAGCKRFDFVRNLADSPAWTAYVVERMYYDTLGRAPDADGQAYWIARLQSGTTVASAAAAFYGSPEYVAAEGGTFDLWLADLYNELLYRSPDASGLSYWVDQASIRGPGTVAYDFYQSAESRQARVNDLYQQFLNRSPDAEGLAYWSEVLNSGDDLALAAFLASSPEYFALSQ